MPVTAPARAIPRTSCQGLDWSKFDQEHFILDYFSVDWEDLLRVDKQNIDNSTKMYLDTINRLLDTYAPLKRINKYKLKFKSMTCVT